MRKLKKRIDYNQKTFELLEETLGEYFITFSSLMQVKNKSSVSDFCDDCIKRAFNITKMRNNLIEKNRKIIKLKFDIISFITYIGNNFVTNKKSLNNFLLLLNIYDIMRNYAGVKEDVFRNNFLDNDKLIKSINTLSNIYNIDINKIIDLDEVVLPDEIIEDFKKSISLLNHSLRKHTKYLFDFVNDKQLSNELTENIKKEAIKIAKELEEIKDFQVKQVPEDTTIYIAIKSRLNSIDFIPKEYVVEDDEEIGEKIKNDIKYFKTNNTKILNGLKRYENLLIKGE